jgi:hypothetical protein
MKKKDSGIINVDKNQTGRWVEEEKDGRTRSLCFYSNNREGEANDETYIGYYHDLKNQDFGCNVALGITDTTVQLQIIKAGSKESPSGYKGRSWTHAEFMDLLDKIAESGKVPDALKE